MRTTPRLRTRSAALVAAITLALHGGVARAQAPAAAPDRQTPQIAVLTSDAKPADKAMACKQLAVWGDRQAVPALAPLLANAELASWARIALEAIPDPAAGEALRQAAATLQGRLLVGAINSLGVRRDAQAAPALAGKLTDADAEVAAAAAAALGRIGGDEAAKALTQALTAVPADRRSAVAQGCILCAEAFMAEAKLPQAAALYDAVRQANVSRQRTVEATRGAILARQGAGLPLLVEQLRSPDRGQFGIGVRTARELPGPDVAKALLAELGRADADRQVSLLLALADRGDPEALPAAIQAAKDGPPQVRLAAIGLLERLGDPAATSVLLAVAAGPDAGLATAAKSALVRLPGEDVDRAVVPLLAAPEPGTRRLAIDLVAQRRTAGTLPALLQAAQDPDEQVRIASLKALTDLAGLEQLPALLAALQKGRTPAEVRAAESAVTAVCNRSAETVAGTVTIVKALYGDLPAGKSADVTKKVATIVAGGALTVMASNTNFGDPAGGIVKKLRVDYTVNGKGGSQTVLENETLTLAARVVPEACVSAVLTALGQASAEPKLALLRILRTLGGPKALDAVRASAADTDEGVRDAAIRALCDWPDADALPDLTKLAGSATSPTYKILALRGWFRLVQQQDAPADDRLASLKAALALVERNDERKLALAALGSVPTVAALAVVTPYLDDPALKEEAGAAAVAIGEALGKPLPPEARAAADKVAKQTTSEQTVKRAKALLGE